VTLKDLLTDFHWDCQMGNHWDYLKDYLKDSLKVNRWVYLLMVIRWDYLMGNPKVMH